MSKCRKASLLKMKMFNEINCYCINLHCDIVKFMEKS